MNDPGHPISLLLYGTLGAALLLALFLYLNFVRKPRNRHPMEGQRERNIEEIREEAPNRDGPGL